MPEDVLRKALERGTADILPSKKGLKQALETNPEKLTFYLGIDPTASFLHLGHTIPARKLEQLRQLGCKVVLLIGGFTATIGDPTDKGTVRPSLTQEEVEANAKNYISLLEPVLKVSDENNPVEIRNNNEWWSKMTFWEFMTLAKSVTVQQLIERDMFQERLKQGKPIYLHEFIYPLLQGYDSVAMSVDGEVGATDQLFNMLVGRDLLKSLGHKDKFILTVDLLVDPTGKKMGKSEGNAVPLDAEPFDMFGKIMAWPDEMVTPSFELLTDIDMQEVEKMEKDLEPKEFKVRLAKEIVNIFHGEQAADNAERRFEEVFVEKKAPADIAEIELSYEKIPATDLLVEAGLADSKSDARRVIEQGGMAIDDRIVEDYNEEIEVNSGMVIKRGKRRFIQVK